MGESLNGGGASLVNGEVRDCIFSNNTVTGWAMYGGGLYITGSGTVERTVFMLNSAHGGGGLASDLSPYLKIDDSDFIGNEGSTSGGGGLRLDGAAGVTISNCRIVDNVVIGSTTSGAGLYILGNAVSATSNLISNSLIAGNTSGGFGGGARLSPEGDNYTVVDCIITNNLAARNGGGLSIGNCKILNCLIAFNRQESDTANASYGGAGVRMGNSELIDCRIEGNVASYSGGGIFADSGLIRNCLIVNNERKDGTGSYGGGGIRIRSDGGLRIENCTITGNSADQPGGGINFYAPATLVNTIIYGNTCSYWSYYDNYYQRYDGTNAVFESCCFTSILAISNQSLWTNCIHVDPRLEELDYTLSPSSPCIDSGFLLPWMDGARDLAGRSRVVGGTVDMGCFEYVPSGTILQIR